QKWENLFKQRLLVDVDTVKEFYAKMKVTHLRKKDVIKSSVKGIDIEFDHERLATILGVHSENGICEYIKEVWEESKYTKPLEITRRVANDETITAARRVKSSEMKPFQRFIHFLVMKDVIPKFGKRDTSSFMDLTYMDHLMTRRLVNLPRVMMRHMSYVISMKDHELPYGDWLTLVFEAFGVPLWIGSGENRRRDDAPKEEEEEEEERNKDDFDWEAVIDEATVEGESGSDDQFYDAQVEVEEPVTETPAAPAVPASSSAQQKDQEPSRVDPSGPTSREADFLKFQAEFERKRANRFHDELEKAKAENAKLLALLHQTQTKPHP
ncbi:hypothetical protein Dimus_033533, partial [Dionaea muscipula]